MEILGVLVIGVLLFLGVRILMRRQAGRLGRRLEEAVTPENARIAAKVLTDEQHRDVYRAIAAQDPQRALSVFRQATGAPIKDCIIAVQALHRFPQKSPSELKLEDELGEDTAGGPETAEDVAAASTTGGPDDLDFDSEGRDDDGADPEATEVVEGELVEDAIDDVRADTETSDADRSGSGQGRTGRSQSSADDADVDAEARRLMEESGFDPDAELTVPAEWREQDEEMAGFHLEVQRGDEKITLSHEDLEPWVHDQLYALLRDDRLDEAAELLSGHSPLTTEEARKFLVVFKEQN